MRKSAVISPCGLYRTRLERIWDASCPPLVLAMLNPSKADAEIDDPTIRRGMGFARREEAGGLVVVNMRSLRATDPKELLRADDPTGPYNPGALTMVILEALTDGRKIVCAWGAHPMAEPAGTGFVMMARAAGVPLWSLGKTKGGHPRHPLYVPASQPLVAYP